MIVTIENFMSEAECAFWRNFTKYSIKSKKGIGLSKRGNKPSEVDREYHIVRHDFKLHDKVRHLIEKNWGLKTYVDAFTIMHYKGKSEGLEWHNEPRRGVVSASVNITPSNLHIGADFQVEGQPELKVNYRSLILYPSTQIHRVTPLVAGEKFSLVMWCKECADS